MDQEIIESVNKIIVAYKSGLLGDITMPEDTYPTFKNLEQRRIYYTLPMALNYQRNSFKLWESAKLTFEDASTNSVFVLEKAVNMGTPKLRKNLLKHKLALQSNKHINTWLRLSKTILTKWGSLTDLLTYADYDYLNLRELIQKKFKKDFPYLSGPKIFNYWMYIMSVYGDVNLKNRSYIEIAPDTHIIKCSIKLKLLNEEDAYKLSREEISRVWRNLLKGSGIDPIDVHSPLWFWSRNKFRYRIEGQ